MGVHWTLREVWCMDLHISIKKRTLSGTSVDMAQHWILTGCMFSVSLVQDFYPSSLLGMLLFEKIRWHVPNILVFLQIRDSITMLNCCSYGTLLHLQSLKFSFQYPHSQWLSPDSCLQLLPPLTTRMGAMGLYVSKFYAKFQSTQKVPKYVGSSMPNKIVLPSLQMNVHARFWAVVKILRCAILIS